MVYILNKVEANALASDFTNKQVYEKFTSLVAQVYEEYVCESTVNYVALKSNPSTWVSYKVASTQLSQLKLQDCTEDERMCLFANAYNMLVIHAIIERKTYPKNLFQRLNMYANAAYQIDTFVFTLNHIEHGMLRGNLRMPYCPYRFYTSNAPELKYATEDPRVHFTLNCGAMSCPQLFCYTNANDQFTIAAKSFLFKPSNFTIKGTEIQLSYLLYLYQSDFCESTKDAFHVVQFCVPYLEDTLASQVKDWIQKYPSKGFTITYTTYDWSINDHIE